MSPHALGQALGDLTLVRRLEEGRAVRLDTADKVLEFMGEPGLRALVLEEIEAYLTITGTKAYVLGLEAVGDRSFVPKLRKGLSPYLSTINELRAWMGTHSTVDERRAIGAATLHKSWFRVGVGAREVGQNGDVLGESWYLNTVQSAKYLGIGRRTLDRLRNEGGGPPFHKFGHSVRYHIDDLDAWARARRRLSTSDDGTTHERAAG